MEEEKQHLHKNKVIYLFQHPYGAVILFLTIILIYE